MTRLLFAAVALVALSGCTPQEVVAFYFQDDADEAWRVVAGPSEHCPHGESGGDPTAVSPGGANHGLWQINVVHRRSFTEVTGQPWEQVYHPVHATRFAKWLHDQTGDFSAWACG